MADLSHLLGAVYGDDAHDEAAVRLDPAPVNHPPEAPDWADDERLDAAFATWTPGPHPEAPAAERAVLGGEAAGGPLADDLAAALSEALVSPAPAPADEHPAVSSNGSKPAPPAPAPVPVTAPDLDASPALPEPEQSIPVTRQWQRSDDDILPAGRVKRPRFSVRLRRA